VRGRRRRTTTAPASRRRGEWRRRGNRVQERWQ
jgi:hypothetical protein